LQLLWPVIGDEFLAAQRAAAHAAEQAGDVAPLPVPPAAPELQRLSVAWQPPAVPALQVARLPLSLRAFAATPEYSWVGQTARAIGTIVHRELQRLGWQSPPRPAAALPAAAARNYLQQLAELGVPPGERVAAQQRIRDAIARSFADPRGQWLLSQPHPGASSERRLSGLIDGRVQDISIDRLLLDAHGTRWVIDFKTSTHEGGGVESFIASELERYAPQLQRYVELARRLGPEPVRAALYFPLLGEFRELAPGGT
jgi:ATP-dependent exoDNAse (exonuclease V) beta subunit